MDIKELLSSLDNPSHPEECQSNGEMLIGSTPSSSGSDTRKGCGIDCG